MNNHISLISSNNNVAVPNDATARNHSFPAMQAYLEAANARHDAGVQIELSERSVERVSGQNLEMRLATIERHSTSKFEDYILLATQFNWTAEEQNSLWEKAFQSYDENIPPAKVEELKQVISQFLLSIEADVLNLAAYKIFSVAVLLLSDKDVFLLSVQLVDKYNLYMTTDLKAVQSCVIVALLQSSTGCVEDEQVVSVLCEVLSSNPYQDSGTNDDYLVWKYCESVMKSEVLDQDQKKERLKQTFSAKAGLSSGLSVSDVLHQYCQFMLSADLSDQELKVLVSFIVEINASYESSWNTNFLKEVWSSDIRSLKSLTRCASAFLECQQYDFAFECLVVLNLLANNISFNVDNGGDLSKEDEAVLKLTYDYIQEKFKSIPQQANPSRVLNVLCSLLAWESPSGHEIGLRQNLVSLISVLVNEEWFPGKAIAYAIRDTVLGLDDEYIWIANPKTYCELLDILAKQVGDDWADFFAPFFDCRTVDGIDEDELINPALMAARCAWKHFRLHPSFFANQGLTNGVVGFAHIVDNTGDVWCLDDLGDWVDEASRVLIQGLHVDQLEVLNGCLCSLVNKKKARELRLILLKNACEALYEKSREANVDLTVYEDFVRCLFAGFTNCIKDRDMNRSNIYGLLEVIGRKDVQEYILKKDWIPFNQGDYGLFVKAMRENSSSEDLALVEWNNFVQMIKVWMILLKTVVTNKFISDEAKLRTLIYVYSLVRKNCDHFRQTKLIVFDARSHICSIERSIMESLEEMLKDMKHMVNLNSNEIKLFLAIPQSLMNGESASGGYNNIKRKTVLAVYVGLAKVALGVDSSADEALANGIRDVLINDSRVSDSLSQEKNFRKELITYYVKNCSLTNKIDYLVPAMCYRYKVSPIFFEASDEVENRYYQTEYAIRDTLNYLISELTTLTLWDSLRNYMDESSDAYKIVLSQLMQLFPQNRNKYSVHLKHVIEKRYSDVNLGEIDSHKGYALDIKNACVSGEYIWTDELKQVSSTLLLEMFREVEQDISAAISVNKQEVIDVLALICGSFDGDINNSYYVNGYVQYCLAELSFFTVDSSELKKYMETSRVGGEKMDVVAFMLRTIILYLSKLSNVPSLPGQLSPRTQQFLAFLFNVKTCSTGKEEGVRAFYKVCRQENKQSANIAGVQVVNVAQARMCDYLNEECESIRQDILSGRLGRLLPQILNLESDADVNEPPHQRQYIRNVAGLDLGLMSFSELTSVDDYPLCISPALIEMNKSKIMNAFIFEYLKVLLAEEGNVLLGRINEWVKNPSYQEGVDPAYKSVDADKVAMISQSLGVPGERSEEEGYTVTPLDAYDIPVGFELTYKGLVRMLMNLKRIKRN